MTHLDGRSPPGKAVALTGFYLNRVWSAVRAEGTTERYTVDGAIRRDKGSAMISLLVSGAAALLSLLALYYARFKKPSLRVMPIMPPAYGAFLESEDVVGYPRLFIRLPLGFINSGSSAGTVQDLRLSLPVEIGNSDWPTAWMRWDGIDAAGLESDQYNDRFAQPFIIDAYSSTVKICRFRAPVNSALDLVGSYCLVLEGKLDTSGKWKKLGVFEWHVSRFAAEGFYRWFAHWNNRNEGGQ